MVFLGNIDFSVKERIKIFFVVINASFPTIERLSDVEIYALFWDFLKTLLK